VNLFVFSASIGFFYYVSTLPLSYYSEFILEHRFSLSNQTLKDWIKREIKKTMVSLIIAMPLVYLVYTFIKYSPLYWWFLTAVSWFFVTILIAKFAPIIIVPLFYKYSRIKNNELKDRLSSLVSRAGFKAEGVYEINISKDTKKANAALLGIGRQKRILLCDTLLKNFSTDEVECVMGHELGHHRLRHITKLILFNGIATSIVFFLTNATLAGFRDIAGYTQLHDFESLVMVYAIISALNIGVSPIQNAFSRKLEKDADTFALRLTGNKSAFISTMKKLSEQNLADPNPGRFYEIMLYNHPPISKRIAFAESFKNIP
jgi:STE24 endopeptidase